MFIVRSTGTTNPAPMLDRYAQVALPVLATISGGLNRRSRTYLENMIIPFNATGTDRFELFAHPEYTLLVVFFYYLVDKSAKYVVALHSYTSS